MVSKEHNPAHKQAGAFLLQGAEPQNAFSFSMPAEMRITGVLPRTAAVNHQ